MTEEPSAFKKIFRRWLPAAILMTLLVGLTFGVIQQELRQAANDPQIQIAEDTANAVGNDIRPQLSVPAGVDIAKSLAPYVVIYDIDHHPVLSSCQLDNKVPVLPKGVFDNAQKKGQVRLTWQPKPGVRSAIVVQYFKVKRTGFVFVGRSLREIEKREGQLGIILLLGWLLTNLVLLTTFILLKD